MEHEPRNGCDLAVEWLSSASIRSAVDVLGYILMLHWRNCSNYDTLHVGGGGTSYFR